MSQFTSAVLGFFLGALVLLLGAAATLAVYHSIPSALPYITILKLFLISGSCGGILAAMQLTDIPELIKSSEARWWKWDRTKNVIMALLISASGGMGGAVAAMFAMILNHNIDPAPEKAALLLSDVNKLTYVATGLIGGFLGFQLLKLIASNFLNSLGAVEQRTDRKIADALKKLDLSEAITQGLIACGLPDPHSQDVTEAMGRLQKAIENFPENRRANIVLGRLYRRRGDLNGAITVLNRCLEAMKTAGGSVIDVDRAAINYNLCCYHFLLGKLDGVVPAEKDRFFELATGYLREVIRLNPKDAKEIASDTDFDGIWEVNAMAQLLVSAGVTPPPPVPAYSGPAFSDPAFSGLS